MRRGKGKVRINITGMHRSHSTFTKPTEISNQFDINNANVDYGSSVI